LPAAAFLLAPRVTFVEIPNVLLLNPGCEDPQQMNSAFAMEGEPLLEWNFGPDTHDTGNASMILTREADLIGPPLAGEQGTVPIEMVALQLVSVDQAVLVDGSEQLLAVTLQSDRGRHPTDPPNGPSSVGDFTVRFGTRSFEVALEVFYDIRAGSVDGPILHSDSDTMQTTGPVPWSADAPAGVTLIPGVNEGLYPAVGNSAFEFELVGSNMELVAGLAGAPTVEVPGMSRWGVAVLLIGLSVLFIRAGGLGSVFPVDESH